MWRNMALALHFVVVVVHLLVLVLLALLFLLLLFVSHVLLFLFFILFLLSFSFFFISFLKIVESPAHARRKGAVARAEIAQRFSHKAVGSAVMDRVNQIVVGARSSSTDSHEKTEEQEL